MTPSAKEKILKVKNSKGDLDVLKWSIFPYAWKPNWFHYSKDEETGELTLTLKDDNDCAFYPTATADDELTLIITSNSDSAGVRARSFALFNANQELEWEEEGETEAKKTQAEWRTNDIRYVVVKFKNEEGTPCP